MDILDPQRRAHPISYRKVLAFSFVLVAAAVPAGRAFAISIPPNTWVAQSAPAQVLPPGRHGAYEGRGWNHLRYVPRSQQMILYDGYVEPPDYPDGNIYANSLWRYDPVSNRLTLEKLSHWTRAGGVTVPLPANSGDPTPYDRHSYAAIVYVESKNSIYLWSGANNSVESNYIGDLWSYSLTDRSWRSIPGPHPFTVFEQAMVYDPFIEKLVLFGAANQGYRDGANTFLFDLKAELWTDAAPVVSPAPRTGQSLCFDPVRRVTWMFGGGDGTAGNELWFYDARANTWSQAPRAGDWPDSRRFASMAYDSRHNIILVWGGVNGGDGSFADTWVLDPGTRRWTKLAPAASPTNDSRNYAEDLDYDAAHDVFVLNRNGQFWLFRYAGPGGAGGAGGVDFRVVSSNPARSETRMRFTLNREADVRIDLVDSLGRRISNLVHGRYPAGDHQVDWAGMPARRTASGVYYLRFASEGHVLKRRLVIVR